MTAASHLGLKKAPIQQINFTKMVSVGKSTELCAEHRTHKWAFTLTVTFVFVQLPTNLTFSCSVEGRLCPHPLELIDSEKNKSFKMV